MKQTSSSRFYWLPPKKAGSFFLAASDDTFRLRHPFAYPLVVALGLATLLLPCVVFGVCAPLVAPQGEWLAIGYLGGFVMGVGLFNLVSAILRQYLGHVVTLGACTLGLALMAMGLCL